MRQETQHWDNIRVQVEIVTGGTGQTGLAPTARIQRISDSQWWDGATWQGTPTDVAMTEVSAANLPGFYVLTPGSLDYAAGLDGYIAQVTEATNSLTEFVSIEQLRRSAWDDVRADHTTAGTFGQALQNIVPTAAAIADAVWDEAAGDHTAGGSTGAALNVIPTLPSAADNADAIWQEQIGDHDGVVGSTAEALSNAGAGLTAADIADAVWDEAIADHLGAGSTGEALDNAGTGLTPGGIADAVWDEARSGHTTSGTFGYLMQIIGGMVQHNHRLKDPTYDPNGRMLTANLVVYPTATDAENDTSALATIGVEMTYDGSGNLSSLLAKE